MALVSLRYHFLHVSHVVVTHCSDEAARNTGEAWANAYTRPQLVCAAVLRNNRRWII